MTRHESRTDGGESTEIETAQGCCGGGVAAESEAIETDQGCCGDDPAVERESGGPGDGAAAEPAGSETDQGCCGSEPAVGADGQSCGDDAGADESSCCGDSGPSSGNGSRDVPAGNPKSPAEFERIREAAERTEALLAAMADAWDPNWTESDVAAFLHDRLRQAGVEPAWERDYCPSVHAGAGASVGHTRPGDERVPPGELLHVDFGVSADGYAADLQRVYYHPTEPGDPVPRDLQGAFEDVRAAIDAGREALEPGVRGHEVDAAARSALTGRGWSAFDHAFGHQVGRDAHDGGTLLGPDRDRYGDRPHGEVRAGEVYSIELGVGTVYGYVGQEEMVRVADDAAAFVVDPQTEIRRLGRS